MRKTQEVNDYELLYYIHKADDTALEILRFKYARLMWSLIHQVCYQKKTYAFTMDDAFQEASVAIIEAIENYRPALGVPFSAYLVTLVKNKILLLIRKHNSKGYQQLNHAIPYDTSWNSEDTFNLSEVLADNNAEMDPQRCAKCDELFEKAVEFSQGLSIYEDEVFKYRNCGYSYAQIAAFTNSTVKQVDNTLQKIRKQWKSQFD